MNIILSLAAAFQRTVKIPLIKCKASIIENKQMKTRWQREMKAHCQEILTVWKSFSLPMKETKEQLNTNTSSATFSLVNQQ